MPRDHLYSPRPDADGNLVLEGCPGAPTYGDLEVARWFHEFHLWKSHALPLYGSGLSEYPNRTAEALAVIENEVEMVKSAANFEDTGG